MGQKTPERHFWQRLFRKCVTPYHVGPDMVFQSDHQLAIYLRTGVEFNDRLFIFEQDYLYLCNRDAYIRWDDISAIYFIHTETRVDLPVYDGKKDYALL